MMLIPQRLFNAPGVRTLARDKNRCVLHKRLTAPVLEREAYVSQHVVSVVVQGKQSLTTYEGITLNVAAGEAVFLPRGLYYVTDLLSEDKAFESLLFYFDDADIHNFLTGTNVGDERPKMRQNYLRFPRSTYLRSFAASITESYTAENSTPPGARATATPPEPVVQQLLHLLNREASHGETFVSFLVQLTQPSKRGLKPFMEANYAKPLRVGDYAYLTGRSLTSFRRDFHRLFSTSPRSWLRAKRMDRAVRLARNDAEKTVNSLAREVGYNNVSYFIRIFKSHTGRSPGNYLSDYHAGRIA